MVKKAMLAKGPRGKGIRLEAKTEPRWCLMIKGMHQQQASKGTASVVRDDGPPKFNFISSGICKKPTSQTSLSFALGFIFAENSPKNYLTNEHSDKYYIFCSSISLLISFTIHEHVC